MCHLHSSNKSVAVRTETLKKQLNQLYDCMRSKKQQIFQSNMFAHLWELKEYALVEGKTSIKVPSIWLDELNNALNSSNNKTSSKH